MCFGNVTSKGLMAWSWSGVHGLSVAQGTVLVLWKVSGLGSTCTRSQGLQPSIVESSSCGSEQTF